MTRSPQALFVEVALVGATVSRAAIAQAACNPWVPAYD
jgi:hypothetical protein